MKYLVVVSECDVAAAGPWSRVFRRGLVRDVSECRLQLSADVLVQAWDVNIQLGCVLLLFLLTLAAVDQHGDIRECFLMLVCWVRVGGFLGWYLHLSQLRRWRRWDLCLLRRDQGWHLLS